MGTTSIIKDTYPKKDFNNITHRGLTALGLLNKYSVELGPRLPTGTAQALSDDLAALDTAVPGAKQAREEVKVATASQDVAVEQGYAKARGIRAAVRKGTRSKDVRSAYGVGQRTNKIVRDVHVALKQIADRAEAQPAEAASFGILQQDVDEMKALLAAVDSTGTKQDQKLASAPLTTRERNLTANRILDTVGRIQGAGMIHFAGNPTVLALFEALGAGPKKTKKAPKAKPSAAPSAPAPASTSASAAPAPSASAPEPAAPEPATPPASTSNG